MEMIIKNKDLIENRNPGRRRNGLEQKPAPEEAAGGIRRTGKGRLAGLSARIRQGDEALQ